MFTVAFNPATDECQVEPRQPFSSSESTSTIQQSPSPTTTSSPETPTTLLTPSSPSPSPPAPTTLPLPPSSPTALIHLTQPVTMETTSSAGRCLKILFVIYNTVLLAFSATSVAFDLIVLSMLVIEKTTSWSFSQHVSSKLPDWKGQMYQTHAISILIVLQSYFAITGLSSPVVLSISNNIQLFYFIYPVIYYIETDDVRSSLVLILALLILYSISKAVTRAIKDECRKREDSMLFVYRGLLSSA